MSALHRRDAAYAASGPLVTRHSWECI